jgi:pimeloyl-ACP methyl ester carboxylesterase
MPFVTSRGQRIHYTIEGAGPLVVFQHGLLSNADGWKSSGFVGALTDKYKVACVDSLGHGSSDKPRDADLYGLEERSSDLVAVIDDLGYECAHLVGYSMGGWMAVGVAKHFPARLSSLVVGGWDCVNGSMTARRDGIDPMTFESLIKSARAVVPDLVKWVTPDVEPGLRACWDALNELEGGSQAILAANFPVLLWNGRDDPNHGPMSAFAAANKLQFLSTAGDHATARNLYSAESAQGIRAFIDATQS